VLRVGSRPSVKMKNSDAPAVKREAEEDWGRRPTKMKNSDAPAVKREAEEDWSKERWR
jgi:hypothetical protein